jgi:hypothetical protein
MHKKNAEVIPCRKSGWHDETDRTGPHYGTEEVVGLAARESDLSYQSRLTKSRKTSAMNNRPNKALQLTTKRGAPIVALLLEPTELNRYAYLKTNL